MLARGLLHRSRGSAPSCPAPRPWPGGLAIAALACAALGVCAPALAQPDPTDVGIFFDVLGTETSIDAAPLATFDIYVLAFDVPVSLSGYELSLTFDPSLTVLTRTHYPPDGVDSGAGDDNWIVGTVSSCLQDAGSSVLLHYEAMLTGSVDDFEICLGPATPSGIVPAAPCYWTCPAPGSVLAFGSAYLGCALVNPDTLPEPVPAETGSWGGVKAVYR
jgi:hypothetical protein